MKNEDVKIGMKVVPHDKTAAGWSNFLKWLASGDNTKPYLFVVSFSQIEQAWILSEHKGGLGSYFNASDFEPYVKPRRKELRAEIERLKAENESAQKQISALKDDIAALQDTIKTQTRQLTVITIERDHYKDNCHEWSVKYDKELAAKDAEIAELKRHDGIRVTADGVIMESAPPAPKKQSASEKQELLPVGTKVMLDYDKDIYAATIIKVNKGDPEIPYFVRFGDGQERWVRRRRVTSIPADPPDLLPIGTRVMLTGTIIDVDEKDDEFPYGVVIDGDVDAWYPKQSVKPLNHD